MNWEERARAAEWRSMILLAMLRYGMRPAFEARIASIRADDAQLGYEAWSSLDQLLHPESY